MGKFNLKITREDNDMNVLDIAEELEGVTNLVERDMLLQKYGAIAPKLTPQEVADINFESAGINLNYAWEK